MDGKYPRVWCHLVSLTSGSPTIYTLAPDPRKLTATTIPKNDGCWLEDEPFLLSHVFILMGGLISEFSGVTLGNFEILRTSTLTIHFFKQGEGFTSGS